MTLKKLVGLASQDATTYHFSPHDLFLVKGSQPTSFVCYGVKDPMIGKGARGRNIQPPDLNYLHSSGLQACGTQIPMVVP
jgi:hypothetical protein